MTKFWFMDMDNIEDIDDYPSNIRIYMANDGYIEGLEFGFVYE